MSKDKYPNIFSPQIEAIEFISLQIFFARRFENWGPRDITQFWLGDIRSRDVFRPIARERKILWIVMGDKYLCKSHGA